MNKPVATPAPAMPDVPGQERVDLSSAVAKGELRLPHENDQAPDSQKPKQAQHQSPEAKKAYTDAARGHPDTSLTPVLEKADRKLQQ